MWIDDTGRIHRGINPKITKTILFILFFVGGAFFTLIILNHSSLKTEQSNFVSWNFVTNYVNVIETPLNLRTEPSLNSTSRYQVNRGMSLRVYKNYKNDTWAKIRYNNQDLYVRKEYLSDSKVTGIYVKSLRVGNSSSNGRWLSAPGERLVTSNIRYLSPQIVINSFITGDVIFYYKIVNSDGSIIRKVNTSPSGYTWYSSHSVSHRQNLTLNLAGWGNANQGIYSRGEYTIEIYYDNILLYKENIRLH